MPVDSMSVSCLLTHTQSAQLAGIDASSFLVITNPSGQVLAPGAHTTIDLAFRPGTLGLRSAELRVSTDDPIVLLLRVGLTGNGVQVTPHPQLSLTPDSINFGPATVGTTLRRAVLHSGIYTVRMLAPPGGLTRSFIVAR